MANEVLEGRFAEEGRAQHLESVEPSSCLVNPLSHEVAWEAVFKLSALLEGVVILSVRHAAALKPAIEDLGHTAKYAFASLGRDGQLVHTEKILDYTGMLQLLIKD